MSNLNILKKNIYTEKSFDQKKKDNVYTFEVSCKSNKFQIKNVVEENFGVKVDKVRISRKKPFSKNRRVITSLKKKAFIKLKKGYRIEENHNQSQNNKSNTKMLEDKIEKKDIKNKNHSIEPDDIKIES